MQPKAKSPRLSARAREAIAVELPTIASAIARVLATLETEVHECSSCGLHVAGNYGDVQVAETLSGTLKKLHRLLR